MASGYFDSPWPAEDGGPQRLQVPASGRDLNLQPGERLACVSRHTLLSTMTVLGAPGEVFLLTHSALRSHLGMPTSACVERLDPLTLRTLEKSPRLQGGPMWPGGMAVHRNGDLYVVYGRYAHRLDRQCRLQASVQLPVDQAYNSFVILDNGLIVTKNLSDTVPARLSVLDPESLRPVCADLDCPEPSIARLSAQGNMLYVVGVRSIFRYVWDAASECLQRDPDWSFDYIGASKQSYGWDVVIDGTDTWFMDNGRHNYRWTMRGAGLTPTPNRLIRVALTNAADHECVEICGQVGGSITNPPLVDRERRIVIGYDSANACLQAWRIGGSEKPLEALWHKVDFGCSSHMILYPDSGELVVNDYRRWGEEVVVLDIETGSERGRVRVGGVMQGVVFPCVGWQRDVYWSSMGKVARIFVTT